MSKRVGSSRIKGPLLCAATRADSSSHPDRLLRRLWAVTLCARSWSGKVMRRARIGALDVVIEVSCSRRPPSELDRMLKMEGVGGLDIFFEKGQIELV